MEEPRREGNCFQLVGYASWRVAGITPGSVIIGSGNRGMLPHIQAGHCLNELGGGVEVRVRYAAVAGPETGVNSQLSKICQAPAVSAKILIRSGRLAGRQDAKRLEVGRLRAPRFQEIPQETGMAALILVIVMNILRHITIKNADGARICL